MKKQEIICDHCKYPILKDGVHITSRLFDVNDSSKDDNSVENNYHLKCLTAATELMVIHKYVEVWKKL